MRVVLAALIFCFAVISANANSRHHHYRHHHHVSYRHHGDQPYICAGCVLRKTLAGVVAVSAQNADRIAATINELWNAGFRGPVHCAAPYGTHVTHSRHYSGNACDMAQYGWGKTTAKVMYTHVADAIIRKHGFTNGCSFRDCGHFGTDGQGSMIASHRHRHYATRHRHYHHYAKA